MTNALYLCYQVFVKRFHVNLLAERQFGSTLALMKIRLALLVFLYALTIAAQPKMAPVKIGTKVLVADAFVGFDNFGFGYFIRDNVVSKITEKAILEYKNLSLGKIARVDIQNPLQVVLFYENFNTVVLLDNQLNETLKIAFSENATPIVASAVGMASSNRLWAFNSLSQKVGLFDYLKNDFREVTVPFSGKVAHYDSDFNYFYWIDEHGNRFACDVYGKVSEYGKFADCDQFEIADDKWILFSKDGILYAYEVASDKKIPLQIAEKTFKSFHYQAQILAIFTTEGITNYKIILP